MKVMDLTDLIQTTLMRMEMAKLDMKNQKNEKH